MATGEKDRAQLSMKKKKNAQLLCSSCLVWLFDTGWYTGLERRSMLVGGAVAAEVVGKVLGEERDDAVRVNLADPVEVEKVASDALEGGGGGMKTGQLDEAVGAICVLDAERAEGVDLLVADEVANDLVGKAVELLEVV